MESTFGLFVLAMGATLLSTLLSGVMRTYALWRRLVDVPNARSAHNQPTPRGGGLAIVATFYVGICVVASTVPLMNWSAGAYWATGIIVAAVGWWDDHGHVAPWIRATAHWVAAGASVVLLGHSQDTARFILSPVAVGLAFLAITLAIAWLTNLFNFMDGIDGIAGSEAVFAAGAMGCILLSRNSVLLGAFAIVLAAAGAGFLFWNWPPAKIFMGDVGSGFLGFVLGLLALAGAWEGSMTVATSSILLGAFVVDATVTLARRVVRGTRWWQAHSCHAYQHLARKHRSHKTVTVGFAAVNLVWLLPWAVAANSWRTFGPVIAGIALAPLAIVAYLNNSGQDP